MLLHKLREGTKTGVPQRKVPSHVVFPKGVAFTIREGKRSQVNLRSCPMEVDDRGRSPRGNPVSFHDWKVMLTQQVYVIVSQRPLGLKSPRTVDGRTRSHRSLYGKPLLIGIFRGTIIPGFLRWCRILSIHSMKPSYPYTLVLFGGLRVVQCTISRTRIGEASSRQRRTELFRASQSGRGVG